jgi:hypothetical protein
MFLYILKIVASNSNTIMESQRTEKKKLIKKKDIVYLLYDTSLEPNHFCKFTMNDRVGI